jgi:hypothetical protein
MPFLYLRFDHSCKALNSHHLAYLPATIGQLILRLRLRFRNT